MNDNDKKAIEKIIYYCDRLHEHVLAFGNSKEEYITNNIKMHVHWLLFKLVSKLEDYLMNLKINILILIGLELRA